MPEQILSPSSIIAGLIRADRHTLSLFLSLIENATALKKVIDKTLDIKKSFKGRKTENHFGVRISETSTEIAESKLSDDALRVALWININSAFKIDPCLPTSPRSIGIATAAIAEPVNALVNDRLRMEKNKKAACNVTFDEAVKDTILTLLKSVIEARETPEKQKEELLDLIKSQLSNLDKETLQKHGIKDLTNSSIRNLLVSSGGLISLMAATEAAGFPAYILAAKLSSIIPFVGGQTLVSILAVVADPVFVGILVPALGVKTTSNITEKMQKAFALTITSMLAISGFDLKWDEKTRSSELFYNTPGLLKELRSARRFLEIKNQKAYRQLAKKSTHGLELPPRPVLSAGAVKLLNQTINKYDPKLAVNDFLFPRNQPSSELAALSILTVGDLLFDMSSIDKDVIEATDFARSADISDEFSFAVLADSILSLPISSQIGHEANILGYTAERVVAAKLRDQGHLVSFPTDANQAGYDLLVDGKEFQVKCSGGSDLQLLETHFSKYPETPVMANGELAEMILDKNPEWASQVFFVEGYTHEFTNNLVTTSIEAGASLYETGIIPFLASVSAARNSYLWLKNKQSLQDASFNVALDTAAKGALSVMGGFAGKGIGLLLFGPAGGIVFGGAGAVLSTTQSHRIIDPFDKVLDKEKDQQLDKAAQDLLDECIKQLKAKLLGIDTIINSFSNGDLSSEMAYRWRWERFYVKTQLREAEAVKDSICTGERRAKMAIKFTYECGIHPVWFQDQYNEIFKLLNMPKDRFKKSMKLTRNFFRSRRNNKNKNP